MSENTKIEWATHSWSPWRGCTKVSPGCANCYAEALSVRNPKVLGEWGKGKPRVESKGWGDPIRWNKDAVYVRESAWRPRVFPSLCDWLDEEVSAQWLANFLATINLTPNLDWLLLTKRPHLWRERIDAAALASTPFHQDWLVSWMQGNPPANVWVGASVEDQARAITRCSALWDIPAHVRWLSVEPLIGAVNLQELDSGDAVMDALTGTCDVEERGRCSAVNPVHWVVVGGESGPKARPCNIEWVRSVIAQCQTSGVPVFVKQLGSHPVGRWTSSPIKSGLGEGWPAGFKINHPKAATRQSGQRT